jgi:hypothetical protein
MMRLPTTPSQFAEDDTVQRIWVTNDAPPTGAIAENRRWINATNKFTCAKAINAERINEFHHLLWMTGRAIALWSDCFIVGEPVCVGHHF